MQATVKDYALQGSWNSSGAGRCQYGTGRRGGQDYFIKRFLSPKYPSDRVDGATKTKQLAACRAFEENTKRIIAAVSRRTATGGNLVAPVDFFRENLTYYKVFEKLDPSAFDYSTVVKSELKEKLFFAKTAASALRVLHFDDIVHSDLKPQNIIIAKTATGKIIPKIVDFDDGYFGSQPPESAAELVGDPLYYSPEMFAYVKNDDAACRSKLSTKSDIFALGLIFAEIFGGTQRLDFGSGYGSAAHYICQGNKITHLEGIELVQIERLLLEMLASSPTDRPDCYGVYSTLRAIEEAINRGRTACLGAPIAVRPIKLKPGKPSPPAKPEVRRAGSSPAEPAKAPPSPPKAIKPAAKAPAPVPRPATEGSLVRPIKSKPKKDG